MNGVELEGAVVWLGGEEVGIGVECFFFFSTVLETNTINKVKREEREGWVYITALQRTSLSAPPSI